MIFELELELELDRSVLAKFLEPKSRHGPTQGVRITSNPYHLALCHIPFVYSYISPLPSRPVESQSEARETILARPYHNHIPTELSCHLSSAGGQGRRLESGDCIMSDGGATKRRGKVFPKVPLPLDGPAPKSS